MSAGFLRGKSFHVVFAELLMSFGRFANDLRCQRLTFLSHLTNTVCVLFFLSLEGAETLRRSFKGQG